MVNSLLPLKLSAACAMRKGKHLVGPIDLSIGEEGTLVIIGPNGSGKTILLRMMHGLEPVRSGSKSWAVEEEVARTRQAFVFQTPIILRRSVLNNIAYPLILRGTSPVQARREAEKFSTGFRLDHVLGQPASLLSGGEQQKLALARALILEPEVLFLDEPCASLDGRSTREIEEMLLATRGTGTKIIMSTHDLGQARRLADEVVFLLHGKVHESASVKTFFSRPETREAANFLEGEIIE